MCRFTQTPKRMITEPKKGFCHIVVSIMEVRNDSFFQWLLMLQLFRLSLAIFHHLFIFHFSTLENCWHKEDDFSYSGDTLATLTSISSWEDCQDRCKKQSRCVAFAYITDKYSTASWRGYCFLSSSVTSSSKSDGLISGKNSCARKYCIVHTSIYFNTLFIELIGLCYGRGLKCPVISLKIELWIPVGYHFLFVWYQGNWSHCFSQNVVSFFQLQRQACLLQPSVKVRHA